MNKIRVRPMMPEEAAKCTEILVTAFKNDPFGITWVPDAVERNSLHTKVFGDAIQCGKNTVMVSDDLDGVAVWGECKGKETQKIDPSMSKFEYVEANGPPGPYMKLMYLGTLQKRKGVGTALIKEFLSQCPGRSALWTGNKKNLDFYKKFGYEVIKELDFKVACAWWLEKK